MATPAATVALTSKHLQPPKQEMGQRTMSGEFSTSDGTLFVSKPVKTKGSKKLRALITFEPRKSHFDTTNEDSGTNEFRGFFSLFWISMFLFILRTYITSYESTGYPLNLAFASMFSRDAITLAVSDAILVGSTAICVPFAKAISKGYIKYNPWGMLLQHSLQTFVLFTAVSWTFNRRWPWVQSGFLTLHSLVMVMKMHSYISVNGALKTVHLRSEKVMAGLRQAALEAGGWNQSIALAKIRRNNEDTKPIQGDASEGTGVDTPVITNENQVVTDASTASALRKRLNAVAASGSQADGATELKKAKDANDKKPLPHVLVHHPDPKVANLASEYSELVAELTSAGPQRVKWPNNVTFKNFAVYQLVPTLVYELEYPRTDKIRPLYVFEKTVAFTGTFALLYTVTETFILPLTPTPDQSFLRSLLDLALPFMISYLLLFYIIFECICNGFAELSYFADRQFYEDWWNSTSWDEFARKWNKPVHTFLLRHVYAPMVSSTRSRNVAMFVTFLASALAHELVMTVVTKKIRMYLFALQLIQIPLIAIGRLPVVKRNKLMGNVVFWLGLYAGFPLLCVAYVAY